MVFKTMHILVIIFGILVTAFFWTMRIMNNRKNIGDAANTVHGLAVQAKNLPRQRRFKKAHNRRGLDLVETPVEAATILMIMIAKSGRTRRVEPVERKVIETLLHTNMQLSGDDADGMILQMDSLTHDIVLPESSIAPMARLLRDHLSKSHAQGLAQMLEQVARADDNISAEQSEFLRRFREPFDLN